MNKQKLTMNKKPLVSVIMPVRNGSRFVRQAIESILDQTYPRFELLIVDDASTDETWKILREFKQAYPRKIRLLRTKKNVGAFAAANIAYHQAKGQYIAPMDSDDVSHPERLAKEVAFLESHPDVVLVSSYARIIDEYGQITGHKRYATDHLGIYKQFASINPIVHPACMLRRSKLPKNALYYTQYGVNSDYYTLFSLLRSGKFANLSEYLLSYRVHGSNSSLQNLKQKFYTISRIRLAAIFNFHYRFPLTALPNVVLQHMIVALVPSSVLLPLYLMLRGMKQVSVFKTKDTKVAANRLIRYATLSTLLLITRLTQNTPSQ